MLLKGHSYVIQNTGWVRIVGRMETVRRKIGGMKHFWKFLLGYEMITSVRRKTYGIAYFNTFVALEYCFIIAYRPSSMLYQM